jgi:hypothetical protein
MVGGPVKLWTSTVTLAFPLLAFAQTARAADDFGWTKTKAGLTVPEGNSVVLNAALPPVGCAGIGEHVPASVRGCALWTKLCAGYSNQKLRVRTGERDGVSATVAV